MSHSPIVAVLGPAATWQGRAGHAACAPGGGCRTRVPRGPLCSASDHTTAAPAVRWAPWRNCALKVTLCIGHPDSCISAEGRKGCGSEPGTQRHQGITVDMFSRPSVWVSTQAEQCTAALCLSVARQELIKGARGVLPSSKKARPRLCPETGVPQFPNPATWGSRLSPPRAAALSFSKPR